MRRVERVWRGRSFVGFVPGSSRASICDAPGATTYGRYGPACRLAPLGAGAEPLEDDRDNARDEREPVEACLEHHSHDLHVFGGSHLRACPVTFAGPFQT